MIIRIRAAKLLGSCPVVVALLLGLVVDQSSQTRGQPGSVLVHAVDATEPLRDREPVIISTDMAMGLNTGNRNGTALSIPDIDDSYAFALAAAHHLDVRGVVVTMGNSMVKPAMATARATVHAVGSDVPVVRGAEIWLPVEPLATADGTTFSNACVNDGVRFMAKELRRSEGLTIAAIGPLTDVACLALNYPEEAKLIKRVVALVGSKPTTPLEIYGHAAVDFNYVMDPRAESIVLEHTSIPFTAINFELSSVGQLPITELQALATSPDPVAQFFGRSSQRYLTWWAAALGPAKPIWDAAVVWHLIRPADHVCQQVGFQLKPGSPLSNDVTDTFSPAFTGTRQVTACTGFTSQQAMADYQRAVLSSVSGHSNPDEPTQTDQQ
jgi:inosine-uridine nucleoside N-ribohydrolase